MSALKFKSAIEAPKINVKEVSFKSGSFLTSDKVGTLFFHKDQTDQGRDLTIYPLSTEIKCIPWEEIQPEDTTLFTETFSQNVIPEVRLINGQSTYIAEGSFTFNFPMHATYVSHKSIGPATITITGSTIYYKYQSTIPPIKDQITVGAAITFKNTNVVIQDPSVQTGLDWLYEETKEINTDIEEIHTQIDQMQLDLISTETVDGQATDVQQDSNYVCTISKEFDVNFDTIGQSEITFQEPQVVKTSASGQVNHSSGSIPVNSDDGSAGVFVTRVSGSGKTHTYKIEITVGNIGMVQVWSADISYSVEIQLPYKATTSLSNALSYIISK